MSPFSRRQFVKLAAAASVTPLIPSYIYGDSASHAQRIVVHSDWPIGLIRPEFHGHFAEHLGSCVYGGLWVGKDSPIPNINGYRKQAVEYLKELGIPVLRWPGGCYADDYHWRDGIGPASQRPKRPARRAPGSRPSAADARAVKSAVVLVSGGLDSATVLAMAVADGWRCNALSIDYGQRHRAELRAAAEVSRALGAAEHRVVSLDLGIFGGSALTDPAIEVPTTPSPGIPVTYVVFPDEGHGFARPQNNIAFNAVAENFLAQCLGGRAEPIGSALQASSAQVPHGAEFAPGLSEALQGRK
jgi:hypothetical protein